MPAGGDLFGNSEQSVDRSTALTIDALSGILNNTEAPEHLENLENVPTTSDQHPVDLLTAFTIQLSDLQRYLQVIARTTQQLVDLSTALTTDALSGILNNNEAIQHLQNSGIARKTPDQQSVDLSTVLTTYALSGLLKNTEAIQHLENHLPAVGGSTEEQLRITSPQFELTLQQFSTALESGQLGPSLSQLAVNSDAVAAASQGNTAGFLKALEKNGTTEGEVSSQGKEKKSKYKERMIKERRRKRKNDKIQHLENHLPAVGGSTEEQLRSTITSPQFELALQQCSTALESGQLGPSLSQLAVNSDAVAAASQGNTAGFLKALEKNGTTEGEVSSQGKEKKSKYKERMIKERRRKRKNDKIQHLENHLPAVGGSTEEQLRSTITSPQFELALQQCSTALESGQLGPSLSQLAVNSDAVAAASQGNTAGFLKALEKNGTTKREVSSQGKKSKYKERMIKERRNKRKKDMYLY